jgi:hypothetical protein
VPSRGVHGAAESGVVHARERISKWHLQLQYVHKIHICQNSTEGLMKRLNHTAPEGVA